MPSLCARKGLSIFLGLFMGLPPNRGIKGIPCRESWTTITQSRQTRYKETSMHHR